MQQRVATRDLAVLVAVVTALTVGLHLLGRGNELRIDWSDPIRWLNVAGAEEAAAAVMRHVGLGVSYWITVSTTLYAIATWRGQARRGFVRWITVPAIRRLVDRALATALVASIAANPLQPALAEEPPPQELVFDINTDGIPIPVIRRIDKPATEEAEFTPQEAAASRATTPASRALDTAPPVVQPRLVPSTTTPLVTTTGTASVAAAYTVVAGDNLWSIAERQVAAIVDDQTDFVSAYWRRLIAVNRTTLRSGDPNLIYPGEIISLPSIEVSP